MQSTTSIARPFEALSRCAALLALELTPGAPAESLEASPPRPDAAAAAAGAESDTTKRPTRRKRT